MNWPFDTCRPSSCRALTPPHRICMSLNKPLAQTSYPTPHPLSPSRPRQTAQALQFSCRFAAFPGASCIKFVLDNVEVRMTLVTSPTVGRDNSQPDLWAGITDIFLRQRRANSYIRHITVVLSLEIVSITTTRGVNVGRLWCHWGFLVYKRKPR